jgi:hypothetical protein
MDAQGHPSEGQPSAETGVRENLATEVEAMTLQAS